MITLKAMSLKVPFNPKDWESRFQCSLKRHFLSWQTWPAMEIMCPWTSDLLIVGGTKVGLNAVD